MEILSTIALCLILIYIYFKWSFLYWKERNMPYLEPSFPLGNAFNPMKGRIPMFQGLQKFYYQIKSKGYKHAGIFILAKPIYIATDPEYISNVLNKHYQYFDRRTPYFNRKEWITEGLFNTYGEDWKQMRGKVGQAFKIGALQTMHDLLNKKAQSLEKHIEKHSSMNIPVNTFEATNKFTNDIIASYAFGIECNSFEDLTSKFKEHGSTIFRPGPLYSFKLILSMFFPNICEFFNMQYTTKELQDFYKKTIKDAIEFRENNDWLRRDLLQIFIELKNKDNGITLEKIVAEALVVFVAGHETCGLTLGYCFYELAINQNIQEKVRNEINLILEENKKLTIDAFLQMTYTIQVIKETLRKYPISHTLPRMCTKDFTFPNTNERIDKGTIILLPMYSLCHDADFYIHPEKFDPDRFTAENKLKKQPETFMPFGHGPRICIGQKFAMMVIKTGLITILQKYHIRLNANTKVPLEFDIFNMVLTPNHPVLLEFEKI